jgi:hypothetical protein
MGCQRPQKNVLNDGHLNNQGTSFSRCHLNGPFRSMIEPQHRTLDGRFKNRQTSIPVVVQKTEMQSDSSNLMQRWENGADYIFLESPDAQEALASYLKDEEAEGVKSVHFYFPNDLDTSTQTINHW